jgi:hypothetical protein
MRDKSMPIREVKFIPNGTILDTKAVSLMGGDLNEKISGPIDSVFILPAKRMDIFTGGFFYIRAFRTFNGDRCGESIKAPIFLFC